MKKQRYHFASSLYSQSYGFSNSHVYLWELGHKKGWAPKNWCFWTMVLEKTLERPWTARRSNQSILKETDSEYALEGLMWRWSSNILGTWCEEPTHWKRPWCWERLKAKREGGGRGWDGWIASLTQWTWIGAKSRRTGEPGRLCPRGHKELNTT